jgi:hypothetical protein
VNAQFIISWRNKGKTGVGFRAKADELQVKHLSSALRPVKTIHMVLSCLLKKKHFVYWNQLENIH